MKIRCYKVLEIIIKEYSGTQQVLLNVVMHRVSTWKRRSIHDQWQLICQVSSLFCKLTSSKPASNLLLIYKEWCKAKARFSKLKSAGFYTGTIIGGNFGGNVLSMLNLKKLLLQTMIIIINNNKFNINNKFYYCSGVSYQCTSAYLHCKAQVNWMTVWRCHCWIIPALTLLTTTEQQQTVQLTD